MNDSNILKRTAVARRTGQWWAIPWWQQEQYYKDGIVSKTEADAAFQELIYAFDAEWFLKEGERLELYQQHPLFCDLLAEGTSIFHYLVRIGLDLRDVRVMGSVYFSKLAAKLKHRDQFPGAHFELMMLAHLLRNGFHVHPESPGVDDQKADFLVSKGQEEIVLELKRPQFDLFCKSDGFGRKTPTGHTKLVGAILTSQDQDNALSNEEIEERAKKFTTGALKKETEKVYRAIKKDVGQLAPEKPGIFLVYSSVPLDEEWLGKNLLCYGKDHKNLLGLIIISVDFTDGRLRYSLSQVPNTNANISMMDFAAVREIFRLGGVNSCVN